MREPLAQEHPAKSVQVVDLVCEGVPVHEGIVLFLMMNSNQGVNTVMVVPSNIRPRTGKNIAAFCSLNGVIFHCEYSVRLT